jgi:Fe-S oxidoreductase
LAAFAGTGVPLVVIDPAIGLTYADEYRKHLPAEKPLNVLSLQQFLAAHAERWSERLNAECEGESYTFFGHCTERSLRPTSDSTWQEVFASFGLKLEPQEVGCCGMCGAFGHERSHLNESKGIYRLSWASPVDHAGSPTRLLVTGHSCRSQVKRLSGIASRHPVEALLARVRRPRS